MQQQGTPLAITKDGGAAEVPATTAASSRGQTFQKYWPALAVAVLTLIAAYLIIPGAKKNAVFGDELRTWHDSLRETYPAILMWRNTPDHAPLNYLLVKLTCDLIGNERGWVMRIPSVICGLLCIPAAFWLGRCLWSNAMGVLVAAFATVDVSLIWQSQQARMYSMLLLIVLVGLVQIVMLAEAGERPRWRWALMGVILGIGMWTHAASIVLWIGVILLAVMLSRQRKRAENETGKQLLISASLAIGIGLLISSPALFRLAGMVDREKIESANVEKVSAQFKILSRELSGRMDLSIALGVLMVAGLVVFWWQAPSKRIVVTILLVIGLLTVLNLFIAAFRRPVHGARYVTTADPSLWIGMAWLVLWGFSNRYRVVQAATGVLLAGHLAFQGSRCTEVETVFGTHQYADEFAQAVRWISRVSKPNDQIVCMPPQAGLFAGYYRLPVNKALETDLHNVYSLTPALRREILPGRRTKWTRRTTWVIAICPPEPNQRLKWQDPRRMLPVLGQWYSVNPVLSVLPSKKPMRVFIYRFNAGGVSVFSAQGKLLVSTKPTTRPATRPRPTTQATTRPAAPQNLPALPASK
ncbi:MAG TPA: glycosyltransferase family 39 protein [Tepidisphaeraceae bacterium]|jgi:4-amino-4-deoxy-L-arabinose transferase-like glycosyltransferase